MGDLCRCHEQSGKKRVASGNGQGESNGRLRDMYGRMYRTAGLLPDVIAKQNPVLLFDMLYQLEAERKPSMENVPANLRWMYGE